MKANFSEYQSIVPVEPKVVSTASFQWNFDEVKDYIKAITEKYEGLLVTDENVADMRKAKSELVSLRTSITKFGKKEKAELKAPYEQFAKEIGELEEIVRGREQGLDEQLAKYDEARKNEVLSKIKASYSKEAEKQGLPYENYHLIVEPKWFNKTAKWADIEKAIAEQVAEQVKALHEEEMAKKLRAAQEASAGLYCELASLKAKLKTPITIADITLTGDTKADWPVIDKAVEERKKIEEEAVKEKEQEVKKPSPKKEAENKVPQKDDVAPAPTHDGETANREYTFKIYGTEATRQKVAKWLEESCIFFKEVD